MFVLDSLTVAQGGIEGNPFGHLVNARSNQDENQFTWALQVVIHHNPELGVELMRRAGILLRVPHPVLRLRYQPHLGGGRPDLLIRLLSDASRLDVYVESKVEQEVDDGQLKGYLGSLPPGAQLLLVAVDPETTEVEDSRLHLLAWAEIHEAVMKFLEAPQAGEGISKSLLFAFAEVLEMRGMTVFTGFELEAWKNANALLVGPEGRVLGEVTANLRSFMEAVAKEVDSRKTKTSPFSVFSQRHPARDLRREWGDLLENWVMWWSHPGFGYDYYFYIAVQIEPAEMSLYVTLGTEAREPTQSFLSEFGEDRVRKLAQEYELECVGSGQSQSYKVDEYQEALRAEWTHAYLHKSISLDGPAALTPQIVIKAVDELEKVASLGASLRMARKTT